MSETFVPLVSGNGKAGAAAFASLNLKVKSSAPTKPSSESFQSLTVPAGHEAENCGKPEVTLQRNGDIVSGIRIQCDCGQVIELACVY
jgi:hypothetical protein